MIKDEKTDHSIKSYLKRLGVDFVRGQLGGLLQFEKTHELTDYDKYHKQLYIEILQEAGESTDLDLDNTHYYPYIRR